MTSGGQARGPDPVNYAFDAERRDRERRHLGAQTGLSGRQRRWLQIGLALVGVAAVIGLWMLLTSEPGSRSEIRPFETVEQSGRTLTLQWSGPACELADLQETSVTETSSEVSIALHVEVPPGCDGADADEETHRTQIRLEQALDQRAVDDRACSLPGYLDHPYCADQATAG